MTEGAQDGGPGGGGSGFEVLEHTADEGIRAWGRDLPELFAAAARGLFAVIADPEAIRPARERRVQLEADSPEELLHDWLEEVNGLHQVHGELYREFEVSTDGRALRATLRGEPIDPERHSLGIEVKAVTWHGFHLEQTGEGFEATVLFDV